MFIYELVRLVLDLAKDKLSFKLSSKKRLADAFVILLDSLKDCHIKYLEWLAHYSLRDDKFFTKENKYYVNWDDSIYKLIKSFHKVEKVLNIFSEKTSHAILLYIRSETLAGELFIETIFKNQGVFISNDHLDKALGPFYGTYNGGRFNSVLKEYRQFSFNF